MSTVGISIAHLVQDLKTAGRIIVAADTVKPKRQRQQSEDFLAARQERKRVRDANRQERKRVRDANRLTRQWLKKETQEVARRLTPAEKQNMRRSIRAWGFQPGTVVQYSRKTPGWIRKRKLQRVGIVQAMSRFGSSVRVVRWQDTSELQDIGIGYLETVPAIQSRTSQQEPTTGSQGGQA